MKKIFLLAAIMFFTLPSFAQRARTLIKIRDMERRNITVEINGRRYDRVARMLNIRDLPPGRHRIKVYVVNRMRNNRSTARLIYTGRIRTRSNHIYYVTVDDYERLDVIEDCCLDVDGPWNERDSWYRGRYYDQQNWEQGYQMNPQNNDYYQRRKNRNRKYQPNQRDEWSHFGNSMSVSQYNALINQLKDASFESGRLNIAKQAIKANGITTQQLLGVMEEMSFENSRVQIAKFAYPNLADPDNAFTINRGFKFNSSQDEFRRFMERQ